MLREGAALSEQSMRNLVALLKQDDKDPYLVAKALCRLDRPADRVCGRGNSADGPHAPTFVSEELEEEDARR